MPDSSLPIKRRRLSRHYRSVNPELADLYPDKYTALAPPMQSDSTSSDVIVLGRSRSIHSRKRTYTNSDVSTTTERWHRFLQKSIDSLRTTPDDLDLHNHQFIPSNVDTFVSQQQTNSFTAPQSATLNTVCTSETTSKISTTVDPLCMVSLAAGKTDVSSYRTKKTMKIATTTTTTIKKRRPLTMNIRQRHSMELRSTAAKNILNLSSDNKCIKTRKHIHINSPQLQNDLERSPTPFPNYVPPISPPISPALVPHS